MWETNKRLIMPDSTSSFRRQMIVAAYVDHQPIARIGGNDRRR
ncbi:hypothetical protein [Rhizobium sp. H4]|nr:hypothetical protein [Rhizobium sp. H4]